MPSASLNTQRQREETVLIVSHYVECVYVSGRCPKPSFHPPLFPWLETNRLTLTSWLLSEPDDSSSTGQVTHTLPRTKQGIIPTVYSLYIFRIQHCPLVVSFFKTLWAATKFTVCKSVCVLETEIQRAHLLGCSSPVHEQCLLSSDLCAAANFGIDLE